MALKKNYAHLEEKVFEMPTDLLRETPLNVLLLEDDSALAAQLREIMESCGFRVWMVSNGAAGLREIMSTKFDAIVCDMVMPNFPGDMFYLAVQRSKPHLCRRFVFTTGHRADPHIDEFIRNVKGLMLFKPFEAHELIEAVRSVIRRAEAEDLS